MKDKRIKACTNKECECNKYIAKNKYSSSDSYCKKCGTELVYVCSKCFKRIENIGPEHTLCISCEAEIADKKDKAIGYVKKVGVAIAGVGAVAVNAAKNEVVKEVANAGKGAVKVGVKIVKDKLK